MKILLVSGAMHRIVSGYAGNKADIVNTSAIALQDVNEFLEDANPVIEAVLITDDALTQNDGQDKEELLSLLNWLARNRRADVIVRLITRDFVKETEWSDVGRRYAVFKLITYDSMRMTESIFQHAVEANADNRRNLSGNTPHHENHRTTDSEKKKSFLDRFRSKSKNEPAPAAADNLTREIEKISRGISKVIAITGHRGSGLTSTAVNLACEANKRGLSAIVIDMDTEYRSANMYFGRFNELSNRDEDLNASLIRTLARPQEYMTTAFHIKENLWLTALGYRFNDRKLIEQFYNSGKLIGLLSVLRNKFNLVILDMPMDLFRIFKDTLIHIDMFGLCVPNNLYSVLSTLRNVEVVLDKETAYYLNAKSKVIVTKYNDRARFQDSLFTPERVSSVLSSGLSDHFSYEMTTAGHVPYSHDFDAQIETDIPAVQTSREYENAFGNILLRLMEGAH